jgi:hypothetical protein
MKARILSFFMNESLTLSMNYLTRVPTSSAWRRHRDHSTSVFQESHSFDD